MVEVKKVISRRDMKKFVKFPTELYSGNIYYVPPFELDEFNLTDPKKNASFDESEAEYFLAYRDNKVVGRIAGIISRAYNIKNNAKYARFSRFDLINDREVAKALFDAAENWAREKGMEFIHGPLGFNDLEREGLMTFGFNTMGSYQSSFNADYYQALVEENGYKPDCEWVEFRYKVPDKVNERVAKIAPVVEKRYGIHEKKYTNKKQLIKDYGQKFFELLDICFKDLYGTVPFNEKLVKQTIGLFNLIINPNYVSLIVDKNDELIGFGLAYASLAKAMNKSKGRYLPFGWARLLKAISRPKTLELALIAVRPDYQKKGVTAIIINNLMSRFIADGIDYCDAGPQLITNTPAIHSLDMLDREVVRRKICYIKKL